MGRLRGRRVGPAAPPAMRAFGPLPLHTTTAGPHRVRSQAPVAGSIGCAAGSDRPDASAGWRPRRWLASVGANGCAVGAVGAAAGRERRGVRGTLGRSVIPADGKAVGAVYAPARSAGQALPYGRRTRRRACRAYARVSWRRGRDSNPRGAYAPNGFRDRPIQPLSHLSARVDTRLTAPDASARGPLVPNLLRNCRRFAALRLARAHPWAA